MNTLKRGQILTDITIEKIGPGGVGISTREDGKKIIVKGSILPHSKITGKITRNKRDYIEVGHLQTTWIDPDRSSVAPKCSHYHDPLRPIPETQGHKYGVAGCQWQIVPYDKQLELKMEMVRDSFRGQDYLLDKISINPIIGAPQSDNYRNKIEFSFGKYITKASNDQKMQAKIEGELLPSIDETQEFSHYHQRQVGYHKKGYWDKIIDVDYCILISEKANTLFAYLKNKLQHSGLSVYDQKKHDGILRSIFIREGVHSGEILVNLVYAKNNVEKEFQQAHRDRLLEDLQADSYLREQITTYIITDNSTLSDAQRWSQSHLEILRGPGSIREILHYSPLSPRTGEEGDSSSQSIENIPPSRRNGKYTRSGTDKGGGRFDLNFQISPTSFFQTNTLGAETLFQTAMGYAQPVEGKSTILDLYCGTGSIGLSFLKSGIGKKLIGIEIVEDAIEDAKLNASLNNLSDQSYFVAGKAEDLVKSDQELQKRLSDIGLVILDPPRSGLHPSVPDFLNKLKAQYEFQLIYISCNPVTLARDLDLLVQGGRELTTLQPVDMFPHTHHVEMISVLK